MLLSSYCCCVLLASYCVVAVAAAAAVAWVVVWCHVTKGSCSCLVLARRLGAQGRECCYLIYQGLK